MDMKRILKFCIAMVLVCTFSAPAHSGLTSLDYYGSGTLTFDDATGLYWLDVILTDGLSYNQAEASVWVTDRGFRHATYWEFRSLGESFGLILDSNYHNDPDALWLTNLMGGYTSPETNEFAGWIDLGSPTITRTHKLTTFGNSYKWDSYTNVSRDWVSDRAGNFLVSSNPFLNKEITSGPDEDLNNEIDIVVEAGQTVPTLYDFKIFNADFEGPPVLIEDTVPAEWNVKMIEDDGAGLPLDCGESTSFAGDFGTVDVHRGGKVGKKCQSATHIDWEPDPDGGMITVWAETRGPKKNGKFAPTSCGALYLNDGAKAFELDPDTGEPLVDELGNRLPPIFESNQLCLAAVEDVNGDGIIVRDGSGDEDGDGLTDLEEACEIGTDPCNPDTDGDGVEDYEDCAPLDPGIYPDAEEIACNDVDEDCDGSDLGELFNDVCYVFVTQPSTFAVAEQACIDDFGGHLVSIHSQAEDDFISDLVDPAVEKGSSLPLTHWVPLVQHGRNQIIIKRSRFWSGIFTLEQSKIQTRHHHFLRALPYSISNKNAEYDFLL
jgi:hypothetical protein